jgi:hypothetical protein
MEIKLKKPKLDPNTYNDLMLDLFEVFGNKLKDRALTLFLDSYYEELQSMPTNKFVAGVKKAITELPHQRSSFPTAKQIRELGYGATDEQRTEAYREMDKSRVLESKQDKENAKRQWENLQLLGKCISLGIPQDVITKQAATGSLRDLLRQYAPAAAMSKTELEEKRNYVRENNLRIAAKWKAEGMV